MTELRLRIEVDETTYTYTDLDMGEGAVEAGRAARDGDVERDDVAVTLDTTALGPWDSPIEVPTSSRIRAELYDVLADRVVVDGVIRKAGGEDPAEDGLRRWTLTIVDAAREELDAALAALRLTDSRILAAVGEADGVARPEIYTRPEGGSATLETASLYSIAELLTACLGVAGATVATVPALGVASWSYIDGDDEEQTATSAELAFVAYAGELPADHPAEAGYVPPIGAAEFVDHVLSLWRILLVVRYAAWPSSDLVAELVEEPVAAAALADPAGLEALDTLALAGWDLDTEPAEDERFALRFANEHPQWSYSGVENPPGDGVLASAAGVSPMAEVGVVPWRQPRVATVTAVVADGYTVKSGRPEFETGHDEPYLVMLWGASRAAALLHVETDDPRPAGQTVRHHPLWARELYTRHATRAADTVVAQIEVDLDDLVAAPVVGTVQYALEGAAWTTTEVREDPDSSRGLLTLSRPAPGVALVVEERAVGVPDLSAGRILYPGGLPTDYAAFAMVSKGSGNDEPDRIEVEYSFTDPGTWPGTVGAYVGPVSATDVVTFRARNVYEAEDETSAWVEVVTPVAS